MSKRKERKDQATFKSEQQLREVLNITQITSTPDDNAKRKRQLALTYKYIAAVLDGYLDANTKAVIKDPFTVGENFIGKIPPEYHPMVKKILWQIFFKKCKGNSDKFQTFLIEWHKGFEKKIAGKMGDDLKRAIKQAIREDRSIQETRGYLGLRTADQDQGNREEKKEKNLENPYASLEVDDEDKKLDLFLDAQIDEINGDDELAAKRYEKIVRIAENSNKDLAKKASKEAADRVSKEQKKGKKKNKKKPKAPTVEASSTEDKKEKQEKPKEPTAEASSTEQDKMDIIKSVLSNSYYAIARSYIRAGQYKDGLFYCQEAAKLDHPEAIFILGGAFYIGDLGMKQNEEIGIKFFKRIYKDNADVARTLGSYYQSKDIDLAIFYYQAGAANNCRVCQHRLGEIFYTKRQYDDSFTYTKLSADQNYLPAQIFLGTLYITNVGPKQDVAAIKASLEDVVKKDYESIKYQLSKKEDYTAALNTLSEIYRKEKDFDKMIPHVQKLYSEFGDIDAAFTLGIRNLHGEGVGKNLKLGFDLLKEAASRGHEGAREVLTEFQMSCPETKAPSPKPASTSAPSPSPSTGKQDEKKKKAEPLKKDQKEK